MKSIAELTKHLSEVFLEVKENAKYCPQASECSNAAGKLINSFKIQLEYQVRRGEKPEIAFLDA